MKYLIFALPRTERQDCQKPSLRRADLERSRYFFLFEQESKPEFTVQQLFALRREKVVNELNALLPFEAPNNVLRLMFLCRQRGINLKDYFYQLLSSMISYDDDGSSDVKASQSLSIREQDDGDKLGKILSSLSLDDKQGSRLFHDFIKATIVYLITTVPQPA